MSKFKRIPCFLLAAAMALNLAGCGGNEAPKETEATTAVQETSAEETTAEETSKEEETKEAEKTA